MTDKKVRKGVYLMPDTAELLRYTSYVKRCNESEIVEEALTSWFRRKKINLDFLNGGDTDGSED
jgi:hypothetical protein